MTEAASVIGRWAGRAKRAGCADERAGGRGRQALHERARQQGRAGGRSARCAACGVLGARALGRSAAWALQAGAGHAGCSRARGLGVHVRMLSMLAGSAWRVWVLMNLAQF